ncbi:MAG TPA: hypothetical protein PLA68_16480 [Panacibacter sp.]|nr:hypothetical protein [Panacibacter sp.]
MTPEELEEKKFELEQKIKLEELDLKRKDLELKIQEQKSKRIFTPLVISIVGGLITIITGLVLKSYDSASVLSLEDKKFQSSLLLKATDAKSYDEFSDMLIALQENGLLSLDSAKIANFRKKRFVAEKLGEPKDTLSDKIREQIKSSTKIDITETDGQFTWTIVAGGDANLDAAKFEQSKSIKNGFTDAHIWYRDNSFRTCIGKYSSYSDAVNALFDVKEKINNSSYVVRFDKWCPHSKYDGERKIYICN